MCPGTTQLDILVSMVTPMDTHKCGIEVIMVDHPRHMVHQRMEHLLMAILDIHHMYTIHIARFHHSIGKAENLYLAGAGMKQEMGKI